MFLIILLLYVVFKYQTRTMIEVSPPASGPGHNCFRQTAEKESMPASRTCHLGVEGTYGTTAQKCQKVVFFYFDTILMNDIKLILF